MATGESRLLPSTTPPHTHTNKHAHTHTHTHTKTHVTPTHTRDKNNDLLVNLHRVKTPCGLPMTIGWPGFEGSLNGQISFAKVPCKNMSFSLSHTHTFSLNIYMYIYIHIYICIYIYIYIYVYIYKYILLVCKSEQTFWKGY